MKQSLSTKLTYFFISAAVLFYFGMQAYNYLLNPQTTTPVYAYQTERKIEANGFFVRAETVLSGSDSLMEIERAEGERVGKNDTVATIYHSESALARHEELERLEAQLEQLKYAQSAAKDAETALKLDGDIREDMIALRASLVSGSYTAAESIGAELKTTVLKREFAYRGTNDLGDHIKTLQDQIKQVRSELSGGTDRLAAPFAGTYSAVVDGYEEILTPDALKTMTVGELESVTPDAAASGVGRLIAGNRWYYAAIVSEKQAGALYEGQELTLRPAAGVDADLNVKVERLSKPENGKVLAVLAGDSHLAFVTLLREQSAELIMETLSGLRVPKNALRVDENGQPGVYCRVGLRAYFKPVEVLYQGEDFILARACRVDSTSNSTIQLYTLRAGDEAIVSAEDLSDGKVIE